MLVAPTKLRGDLLSLAEMGVDPRPLLQGSGISYEEILAQRPLRDSKLGEIYDRLTAAMPEEFAILCGRSIRLQYLGLLGYRLSNCSTVGDVLADWAEQCGHIGYPLIAQFNVQSDMWSMHFRPRYTLPPRAEDFCVTSTLAGFTQSLFNLSGHRIRLRRIGFQGPASNCADAYAALEADEIQFHCPVGFVEGAIGDLDRPIATADADLRQMCDNLWRQFRENVAATEPLTERLADLFAAEGPLALADAGRTLGMSSRSLQRHLAAEDSSYHIVLDDYRRERGLQLIQQGKQSKAVAHALGFTDVSSFRRSFKRWTGMSARQWR